MKGQRTHISNDDIPSICNTKEHIMFRLFLIQFRYTTISGYLFWIITWPIAWLFVLDLSYGKHQQTVDILYTLPLRLHLSHIVPFHGSSQEQYSITSNSNYIQYSKELASIIIRN